MSTHDVPGAKPENHDVLAMGAWAEHEDGSLIFVESVEVGTVVFSVFDVSKDPVVEYRDAMPEQGFKDRFSWDPDADDDDNIEWTWHDKTPMPWDRVMADFPAGSRYASAVGTLTAAERVGRSLDLDAQRVRRRQAQQPTAQVPARRIMTRLRDAVGALKK